MLKLVDKFQNGTPTPFKGISRNFMTPNLVAYYDLGNGQYAELSTGGGFDTKTIYGVTVRPDPHKQSQLCWSKEDALFYIEQLTEGNDNESD